MLNKNYFTLGGCTLKNEYRCHETGFKAKSLCLISQADIKIFLFQALASEFQINKSFSRNDITHKSSLSFRKPLGVAATEVGHFYIFLSSPLSHYLYICNISKSSSPPPPHKTIRYINKFWYGVECILL